MSDPWKIPCHYLVWEKEMGTVGIGITSDKPTNQTATNEVNKKWVCSICFPMLPSIPSIPSATYTPCYTEEFSLFGMLYEPPMLPPDSP
jgi:hypothetical protein